MWNPYQYGQGKLKLVKDLKTGQAHLRASLIDREQINDLGHVIYKERKGYYKIDQCSKTTPPTVQQQLEEEGTAHLSYKEKVDLYRRRLQSEKLQDKYNTLFKKTEKRRFQMRNPILYKLLQNFQDAHRHQDQMKVVQDLKESEKNLEMIKINTNRRARFQSTSCAEDDAIERPKFLSLESGLPQKQRRPFPKWTDYSEGRFVKIDNSNQGINIGVLQANIDMLMGNNPIIRSKKHSQSLVSHSHSFHRQVSFSPHLKEKISSNSPKIFINDSLYNKQCSKKQEIKQLQEIKQQNLQLKEKAHDFCERCKEKEQQSKIDDQIMNRAFKSKSAHQKRNARSKIAIDNISKNAARTFTRSQNYSKDVIATMTGFYDSKASKKAQYKKMVYFLKNDRPLTSDIRRRNYKMIGQTSLKEVKQYRNYSQQQRLKLRDQNYNFYLNLLKSMQSHGIQQLPLSGKIIERIRVILQSNYILSKHHYQVIAEPSLYQQRDETSQFLLGEIQKLINNMNH